MVDTGVGKGSMTDRQMESAGGHEDPGVPYYHDSVKTLAPGPGGLLPVFALA
jgi:hypothetical protein